MIQEGKFSGKLGQDFPFIIFKFSSVIEDDFVIDECSKWKMRNEKWKMENLEHSLFFVSLCLCG